jgi:hypothetical protein
VVTIKYKFLLILLIIGCLLLPGNVFADDVGITDVITYQAIEAGTNFDVNVLVTNNSTSSKSVDINVQILYPTGVQVANQEITKSISADSSEIVTFSFDWDSTDVNRIDTNYSVNSHIINVYLEDDFAGASTSNNFYRKYFVISKPDRKTPVPDFPIIFSLLLVFAFVVMYSQKPKKVKNKN